MSMAASPRPVWLLLLVPVLLAAALLGGLARVGMMLPALPAEAPLFHGPLMVSGVFGALISLERAVALRRRWALLAPLCAFCSGGLLLLGGPWWLAAAGFALASAGLLAASFVIWRIQPADFTRLLAVAALLWLVGNLAWLAGWPVWDVVGWWQGFLLLTIVAERLELSRLLRRPPHAAPLLNGLLILWLLGMLANTLTPRLPGLPLVGLSLVGMAAWLARYDLARRTVRQQGLPRYIAASLLAGYVWLAVSGLLLLGGQVLQPGPGYDAVLHTLFVGFVFSMVFGHAPVILPALTGWRVPYRPLLYLPLALLHGSLLLRLAGDLLGRFEWRQAGSLLNGITLLLFLALMIGLVRLGKTAKRPA
ncbi:conserved hypothetical protein [Pseudogulbenkiania ferrooxidans 2002]|uniref:NnrS family protein n=2 Tax=Pseudogulbenkiania ferrooxidans TaxID=549169 RepID=B9YZN2_9NEIS|nr:conserved hypothetical protein [Pseudogulbenkiania ferrooxidans 2002]